MRKTTTLLLMLAIGLQLMAQKGFEPVKRNLDYIQNGDIVVNKNQVRAPGDIIFSEDFDGADWSGTSNEGEPVPENAPEGWTIGDESGNGFYFRWDTVGPRGLFTNPYNVEDSCQVPQLPVYTTTQSNGYMMLESDWYMIAEDCSEFFADSPDSYIEYNGGIDFSEYTAIHLIFEQCARFCCGYSSSANAWFRISTDNGTTWTDISVVEADINEQIGEFGGPAFVSEYDLTQLVSGESDVWFRFHFVGLSHYHWEIDDVAFVVPENNDIKFLDYWNDYIFYRDGSEEFPLASTHDFTEGFYEYPWFISQEFKGFHAAYNNFGGQAQTNFVHNVEVWKDGSLIESFESEPVASVTPGIADTTNIQQTYVPVALNHANELGLYTFVHYPSTDNVDDIPSNDTLYRKMRIGDDLVKVVDFNKTNSRISPDNWVNYDEDGDGLGFIVNLPDPSLHATSGYTEFYELDGLHVFIDRNTFNAQVLSLFENEEAKAIASFYKFDEENDTLIEQISSAEYTFSVSDTMSVVYIEFAKDGTSEYIFEGGKFLVALNMYGTWVDAFGFLRSWNIRNSNSSIQKHSYESCVTVNASIETSEDIGSVIEGPAFALQIQYTGYNPPPTYYATFIVRNTLGEFIEGANVELYSYKKRGLTDSLGKIRFAFSGDYYSFFDYVVSYEGFDTVFGSGAIFHENVTYNITMNHVGIQNTENIDFSIYPNPSTGVFNIACEGTYNLQIMDVSGKVIYESYIADSKEVDLSYNTAGVYFINLLNQKQTITKRIIIQ